MRRVVIVYRSIFQYRREFYEMLRDELKKEGIELVLVYGKWNIAEFATRKDQIDLEWGHFVQNRTIHLGPVKLLWQPCLKYIRRSDVVIVEQASKLLVNYYLMITRQFKGIKFCYWGHGRNMQDQVDSLANKFKQLFIRQCDWWFAYTASVKKYLTDNGYAPQRITAVQNAIDTRTLQKEYRQVPTEEIAKLYAEFGIEAENRMVGIYCGAMYPDKKMDFIIESCKLIRAQIKNFHMIFIGSGVDAPLVHQVASENEWIHYVGPKFGRERVKYFKLASIQLMPGAVGLGVLDSFALETPLMTTSQTLHGPEIDYLEHGRTGIITEEDVQVYATTITELLQNGQYEQMIGYCREAAQKYTLENMVNNFKQGILDCMASG